MTWWKETIPTHAESYGSNHNQSSCEHENECCTCLLGMDHECAIVQTTKLSYWLLIVFVCLCFAVLPSIFSTQRTTGSRTWTDNIIVCPAGYCVWTSRMVPEIHISSFRKSGETEAKIRFGALHFGFSAGAQVLKLKTSLLILFEGVAVGCLGWRAGGARWGKWRHDR